MTYLVNGKENFERKKKLKVNLDIIDLFMSNFIFNTNWSLWNKSDVKFIGWKKINIFLEKSLI